MSPSPMRKKQTSHSWRSLTLWWASLVWFRRRNAAFTLKRDLRDNERPYHLKIKPLSSAKVSAASILSQFFLKRQQCPRPTVTVTLEWNPLPLEYGSHSSQAIQLRSNPSSLSGFQHALDKKMYNLENWAQKGVHFLKVFIGISVQFSLSVVSDSDPMNRSTPGLPVHHPLSESIQTHVHRVGDAIQPSHPLSSPSPPAPTPSQHQGLFQWVNCSHEVAKVLEFQLQH